MLKKSVRRGSEKDVINIKQEKRRVFIGFEDEKRGVRFRKNKNNGLNKSGKTLKPSTRSLFKTI